jgi:hypothetical protein
LRDIHHPAYFATAQRRVRIACPGEVGQLVRVRLYEDERNRDHVLLHQGDRVAGVSLALVGCFIAGENQRDLEFVLEAKLPVRASSRRVSANTLWGANG